MIKYFQHRAYKKALARIHDKRVKEITDFASVKTIGILFEIKDEQNYKEVLQLIDAMRSQQKKLYALGFYNDKHLPVFCEDTLFLSHISKKDIKGFAFPKGDYVNRFTNRNYDLIINFDPTQIEVLFYLFAKIKAKCKASPHIDEYENVADLMINMEEEEYSYETFIKELVHYLNEFSKK